MAQTQTQKVPTLTQYRIASVCIGPKVRGLFVVKSDNQLQVTIRELRGKGGDHIKYRTAVIIEEH